MTKLNAPPHISLTAAETDLLENAYPSYKTVILEKEFGGGFSDTRVFLMLPVKASGAPDARLVTKIGAAADLQREKDNYDHIIRPALPFSASQVIGYAPLGDQAAIHYAYAGGGALGKSLSLEDYYHAQPAEAINQMLEVLLDQTLGEIWYGAHHPYTELLQTEYGHHLPPHQKLVEIVSAIYPRLAVVVGGRVQIPGVAGTYPDPLTVYPNLLGRTLKARRSFVHGDLHVRNILVDETGRAWLIDFAKVKERHNLFDFIKLETYIRLMALAQIAGAFSLNDYAQFERSLNQHEAPPTNPELAKASLVIQNIRKTAQKYMGPAPDFKNEYFPALFLYSFSMLKYFHINGPFPTQLMFMTSCVLAATIFDPSTEEIMKPITNENQTSPEEKPSKNKEMPRPTGGVSIGGNASGNVIVNGNHNVSHINTGGGTYVGGSIKVTNGDFVGGDKIITDQHSAASADEIAAIFELFLKRVDEMHDGPAKTLAQVAVQGLEIETKKGEQAVEKNVSQWFDSLASMAPDILDVIVNTLASPINGLSSVVRKIAIRLRETRKR